MQIDELRGELTTLADEIGPFTGDATVTAPPRHAGAGFVTSALAVALVLGAGVSIVARAARRHRPTPA